MQKAKERYSKERAAEYYFQNKDAIKEKTKISYKIFSEEEKDRIRVSKEMVSSIGSVQKGSIRK